MKRKILLPVDPGSFLRSRLELICMFESNLAILLTMNRTLNRMFFIHAVTISQNLIYKLFPDNS